MLVSATNIKWPESRTLRLKPLRRILSGLSLLWSLAVQTTTLYPRDVVAAHCSLLQMLDIDVVTAFMLNLRRLGQDAQDVRFSDR